MKFGLFDKLNRFEAAKRNVEYYETVQLTPTISKSFIGSTLDEELSL
jgi:hypothetical protein